MAPPSTSSMSNQIIRSKIHQFTSKFFIISCLIISLAILYLPPSQAGDKNSFDREFLIGLEAKPTSLDPHTPPLFINIQIASNVFEGLFLRKSYNYESELLSSYKVIDPYTWEFNLKPDLYLSNGQRFTTRDIIYTLDRIFDTTYFPKRKEIYDYVKSYQALDQQRFTITTKKALPALPDTLLDNLYILGYQADFVSPEDFMKRKAYIGSGPYQLVQWSDNGDIRLKANPYYHGSPPYVKAVRFKSIPDAKERIEALQKGQVDLIERIPPDQIQTLGQIQNIDTIYSPADFLVYLVFDVHRDQSPFVRDHNGQPLKENPLKKPKVRQAISHAINRKNLVQTVLYGAGIIANQLVRPDLPGYSHTIPLDKWSPQKAKSLLAEAGYPNGFQLTLHHPDSPKVSVYNAKVLAEAIAANLNEIGIEVILTGNDEDTKKFMDDVYNANYSSHVMGLTAFGSLSVMLQWIAHSHTPDSIDGILNSGRYSNSDIDQLLTESNTEFDAVRRLEMQVAAMEIFMEDRAILPLYFQKTAWAIRNDIGVELWQNPIGMTLPQDAHPATTRTNDQGKSKD